MSRFAASLPLRLVLRELRGGLRGFGVFALCLALGVFAISAVGCFTGAARQGLERDARALLGGDLEIVLPYRELTVEQRVLLAEYGRISHLLELRGMAGAPDSTRRLLVEVKGVDTAYPLYGQLELRPDQPLAQALAVHAGLPGALVEESLLSRLALQPGARLRLGEGTFRIAGVIRREPDRAVRAFTLGPRVLVSREALAATGLLAPGSLVNHLYRLQAAPGVEPDQVRAALHSRFPTAGWRLRSYQQAAPRVSFFLDRLQADLTLLGLCSLLVGGLGVAGAVRGYLSSKITSIATLRCLGASRQLVFRVYLLLILAIAAGASLAGMLAGALVPVLAQRWLALPIPLQTGLQPLPVLLAGGCGLLVTLLFSLGTLAAIGRVSPALLFRRYGQPLPVYRSWRVRGSLAVGTLVLLGLAGVASGDRLLALWFGLGAAAGFASLYLLGRLLLAVVVRLPRPRITSVRIGLSQLQRPGAPARSILLSLGLGLSALVCVVLVEANLAHLVQSSLPERAPSFFFVDIQSHQIQPFRALVQQFPGVTRLETMPTLRGRITHIAGVPVAAAQIDPEVAWAVRGDRYLTYSATLPRNTSLSAGSWWPADYRGAPQISLTSDLAKGFGVGLGDSLTLNVLGRQIEARIGSLRTVDWSTLELNFAIIFAPGLLESAPQAHLATVYLPAAQEGALLEAIGAAFPNVSAIGMREVLGNLEQVLRRIGVAFRAMAGVVLLSGLLVLAGAVSADQHQRLLDAVIYKVCGAGRGAVLAAFAMEFLLLGGLAALFSLVAGSLAAFGVVQGAMDIVFRFQPLPVLATALLGMLLCLAIGLLGTLRVLGRPAAPYLRND